MAKYFKFRSPGLNFAEIDILNRIERAIPPRRQNDRGRATGPSPFGSHNDSENDHRERQSQREDKQSGVQNLRRCVALVELAVSILVVRIHCAFHEKFQILTATAFASAEIGLEAEAMPEVMSRAKMSGEKIIVMPTKFSARNGPMISSRCPVE